jgi:hypothetical protein
VTASRGDVMRGRWAGSRAARPRRPTRTLASGPAQRAQSAAGRPPTPPAHPPGFSECGPGRCSCLALAGLGRWPLGCRRAAWASRCSAFTQTGRSLTSSEPAWPTLAALQWDMRGGLRTLLAGGGLHLCISGGWGGEE